MLMLAKLRQDDGAAGGVGGVWVEEEPQAQEIPPQEQQEAGAEPSHLEVIHKHQRRPDVPTSGWVGTQPS